MDQSTFMSEQENSMASSDSGVVEDLPPICSLDDDDTSSSADILTKDMIEEECVLERNNAALLEKKQREIERAQSDEAIREQSKKRLLNILQKSQFYVSYMKTRMEQLQAKPTTKVGKKRKLNDTHDMYSEVSEALKQAKVAKTEDSILEQLHPTAIETEGSSIQVKSHATKVTPMGIEVSEEQPQLLEGVALRQYQLEGFNWLKGLFEGGMNGILADEMGLGKTVQTISLICHLYTQGVHGPFLIVAPLSTLPNWIQEIQSFAPKIPVVLYHGSAATRQTLIKSITKKTDLLGHRVMPVVITSFEVPLKDERVLGNITWKYMIIDEGHRIKNYQSNLARCLTGFRSINRLILTGTPLQNELKELWSLLHFILPEIFDTLDVFETLFTVEEIQKQEECVEKEEKANILTLLQEILTPFLLRRVKADVDLKIPGKKEILVRCTMTKTQFGLYSAVLDKSILMHSKKNEMVIPDSHGGERKKRFSKLRDPNKCLMPEEPDDGEVTYVSGESSYKLNVKMTVPFIALLKISNHPYLIHPKVLPGSDILQVDNEIIESSGKMAVMDGLLKRLKKRDHRVLLFSTSTAMLDLIEDYAQMVGHTYRRLDGSTDIKERRQYIKEFNTDPSIFMFLLSTRAGGLGINLTGADTVIIYNSDWNPQADLQAQDRCHRIGQTKPVVVYRLMTTGTFDERVVERAVAKRKLEKMVIQQGKFKHGSAGRVDKMLSLEELRDLLNEKQHKYEVQPNGTLLTDEQWEELLDRRDLNLPEEKIDEQENTQSPATTTARPRKMKRKMNKKL